MTFDPTKPCTTRDGREVRLFAERMKDGRLVGTVTYENGQEAVRTWRPDGTQGRITPLDFDLINIPEKRTVWVNAYKSGNYTVHRTRSQANAYTASGRIACVNVEFEEGEGL